MEFSQGGHPHHQEWTLLAVVEAESEVLQMEQVADDIKIQGTSGILEFQDPEARPLNIALSCAKGGCAQNKCLRDMLSRH